MALRGPAPVPTWLRNPAAANVLDATLVVSVFVVGVIGHVAARTNAEVEAAAVGAGIIVCAAAAAAVLWWRRTRPLLMLLALLGVAVVGNGVDEPGLFAMQVGIELMLLFYAAGAWCTRPRLAFWVAVVFGVLIGGAAINDGSGVFAAGAFSLALVAFPLMTGYAARARRLYVEEVERRLLEAERDRDERARRAIVEERTRIARELHDVVAHHVSLIGVQAGAARTALGRSPESTRAALAAIEASSRDAVGEMHKLLDVLRPLDGTNGRAPQPGLRELPALLDRWRAAGFDVELGGQGGDDDLEPMLSLCCYRVIEEALTNVARHSSANTVAVEIEVDARRVRVAVRDPGPARATSSDGVAHRGLVGMAERVELLGGVLAAATDAGGGFAVEALLPRR